ncbi:hypothetical protein [Cryobacterium sp. Y62]|uniref:hypothetical protein n=1 Tax=Cryobacterium sp. Y62 TaxID=2048284 RepID=UPI000CE48768|nr:hypothetical protein [Cryobacterium sp. Y62]
MGIGAALTVTWSMVTGDNSVSWLRITLLLGLICCIVGLKLVDTPPKSCSSRGWFFERVDEHALTEEFVNVTPAP